MLGNNWEQQRIDLFVSGKHSLVWHFNMDSWTWTSYLSILADILDNASSIDNSVNPIVFCPAGISQFDVHYKKVVIYRTEKEKKNSFTKMLVDNPFP